MSERGVQRSRPGSAKPGDPPDIKPGLKATKVEKATKSKETESSDQGKKPPKDKEQSQTRVSKDNEKGERKRRGGSRDDMQSDEGN
jgi:hypothetical protein